MRSDKTEATPPKVGGQAIIEGVMMRGPERISAAVRTPDGDIRHQIWESKAWHKRTAFLGWPVIRGAVSLAEALVVGVRTLNWSADVALEYEKEARKQKKSRWDTLAMAGSLVFAVVMAVVLFMWVPYQLANWLKAGENQPLFHLIAGSTRILFFLVYLWMISRLKDIKRVFQYHGAEHQTIYAYEDQQELTPDNTRQQSRFHPRCGTSFILIVALLTMVMFVIFDIIVVAIWGSYPSALVRLLVHLPFLPLVAGISYEVLRLSDKHSDTKLFQILITPGLALQRLTTNEPDDSQREVAICALKFALPAAIDGDAVRENIAGAGQARAAS